MSPAVTSARWDQLQLWFFMSCIHTLTQMLPGVPSAKCSLCDTHIHTRLQTDLQQERVAAANRGKLMFVLRRQVFHCKLPRQSLKMPGFTASRFPAACPHPLYDTFQRLQPTQNALVKVAWSWIKRAPRRTEEVSALCRNIPTSLTVFFFNPLITKKQKIASTMCLSGRSGFLSTFREYFFRKKKTRIKKRSC